MRDAAFEASGRALSAALWRSSCSGTDQQIRETVETEARRCKQGAIAKDLVVINLGEISLGEKSMGEIDLGEINLGDNRRGRFECKIMLLGEVSLQETTATTLAAMP